MDQGGDKNYWQQNDGQLDAQPVVAPEVAQPAEHDEPDDESLSWQASEDVHHEKDKVWFGGLLVATIVFVVVAFLLKSWTFAVLVVVMAVAVVVFARRPPRVMQYHLNHHGIQINEKTFSIHDFRAFGVLQDGPLYSVVLLPMKRFMPSVNVYFPVEQGEYIVDVFGEVLPMEHVEPDFIDRLSRKLRF